MGSKQENQRTLFTDSNGVEWIFDCKAFKEAIDQKAVAFQKEHGYKKPRKMDIYRRLTFEIMPHISDESERSNIIESITGRMKKWYKGKNGPSLGVEDVEKMEKYLGCHLLTTRFGTEKTKIDGSNDSMKTSAAYTNVSFTHPLGAQLDLHEAKRNAARNVYGVVCDLIRMQQKLLYNFFMEGFPIAGTAGCVPEGFPVYSDVQNDIYKYGFDLPRDLIEKVMDFVQDIYGSWIIHLEDADVDIDNEYKERFDQWLGRPGDKNDFIQWCDFINEQTLENYELLDEIFDDYISW